MYESKARFFAEAEEPYSDIRHKDVCGVKEILICIRCNSEKRKYSCKPSEEPRSRIFCLGMSVELSEDSEGAHDLYECIGSQDEYRQSSLGKMESSQKFRTMRCDSPEYERDHRDSEIESLYFINPCKSITKREDDDDKLRHCKCE